MLFLEAAWEEAQQTAGAGQSGDKQLEAQSATWRRRRCGQFALAFKNKTATVNNDKDVAETGNVDGNTNSSNNKLQQQQQQLQHLQQQQLQRQL